ncbi:MAG: ABC transporter ATP-binding protein [Bifidobacteriaceae bacterium]|nr:ABC transporter ATP-binding protein [Bifidobacteriaceae bacterium]
MTAVLRIEDLTLDIVSSEGTKPILRGVSLEVEKGSVQGLAGESGSGKTITGLSVIGLEPAGAKLTGRIWLEDIELVGLTGRRLGDIRGRRIGMVFQDPTASLHPQLTIGSQLTDHIRYHLRESKRAAQARALDALNRVGITASQRILSRYPHEFSGGQRQRIAIAIALACEPEVLIADEPTTALDVTVQAGVLALIRDLVDTLDLAVLFVTHDLGVMSAIADRVAIMRGGQVVEAGDRHQVFTDPQHPYTRALLASLPGAKGGINSRADLRRLDLSANAIEGDGL